jgi:predicted SAM-dependent methyltransferase
MKFPQTQALFLELSKITNTGHHGLDIAIRRLKKETIAFNNHYKGKENIPNKIKNKLHIGCGKRLLNDFTNICEPADIIYDLREGIPVSSNSIETIFSEHFFEHIDYPKSSFFFIDECYRVLKKGGECIIGVPDTEIVLNKYIENDILFFDEAINSWYTNRNNFQLDTYIDLVNYHMRDQIDSESYEPHFWGYDYKKLKDMLLKVGFKSVKKWKPDNSICNPKRIKYSLYVSANK